MEACRSTIKLRQVNVLHNYSTHLDKVMGKVSNQSPAEAAAAPPSSPLTHFTHTHELHALSLYSPQSLCSGCKLQSSGIMYTCNPCTFTLHQSCAKLQQVITHPSHGGCTLTLLTTASYPGGIFRCDACSRLGDGWSYHCSGCQFDLHVACASKPLKIRHQAHRSCELELTFKNPYKDSDGFLCDICGKIGSKQWLYHCKSCEFDAHLDCTTASHRSMLQDYSTFLVMGMGNPAPQGLVEALFQEGESSGEVTKSLYSVLDGGFA